MSAKILIIAIIVIIGTFLAIKIPLLIEEIELQQAKSEVERLSDYIYENMELPSGCSYSGNTRYISCLDISVASYDGQS